MAQGRYIQPADVPIAGIGSISAPHLDLTRKFRDLKREVVEAFERQYVQKLLRLHNGNVAAASRQAGMDRKNLWALAKKYDIDPKAFRQ